MKFTQLEISSDIKKSLLEAGYEDTTSIQEEAIPKILNGKDIIGQSKTGTGKTASYGIPLIEKMDPDNRKIQGIILCPTRELAIQVSNELRKFTKYVQGVSNVCIYGGEPIERQIMALKKRPQIIIGTPGRIMDHMRRKTIKLDNVTMCVLDEADEMLNMGFEEDMETILGEVPEQRQTVLFSATMNKHILNISKKYLKNPTHVKIQSKELTVNNIEQISITIKEKMKTEAIIRIFQAYNPKKAIVFCNTKRKVDLLIENLKKENFKAEALHGDVKQSQRERIMNNMKKGNIQILVATDVAARGIDIDELELVVNYDVPQEEEYYVHRIGRTGRNGNVGKAFTFVVGKEKEKLKSIKKYSNAKIVEGNIPTISEINKIKSQKTVTKIQDMIDNEIKNKDDFEYQDILELLLKNNNNDSEIITKALLMMACRKRQISSQEKPVILEGKDGMVKLFLNLGKRDKIMAKDIIGSITANCAVSGSDIGKIKILENFSFVEVPTESANEIISSMNSNQIKGKDCNFEIANA